MKFGIIGFGNLGKAYAAALVCTGDVPANDIYICDSSCTALALAEKESYHIYTPEDINKMIRETDVITIVVKGYVFEELAATIDKNALCGKFFISLMAGMSFEKVYSLIGEVNLARAMPSLAIAVNDGVMPYTKVPPGVAELFNKFGYAFEVEPDEIDKAMAFASCGLGFAAHLMDAFAAAGEAMGFSPEIASQITALTFKNAGNLGNFRETVSSVATPGGATEQGIKHMEKCNVHGIVATAMQKAKDRVSG